MQLPKIPDIVDRDIKAGKMQPSIQKHAAMPGGQNESVSTKPTRIIRVIVQRPPK
jgi:hypothetical protein